ncbi:MAG: hypothetical protein OXG85_07490 [Chloroflexi bacterium]|nr:hypothetical protein [Chloroflexota bacterium]
MKGRAGWRRWSRRILLALLIAVAVMATPFFALRLMGRLALALDGRQAKAEDALRSLTVYPHGGFSALKPEDYGYEILQRQVLRHPSGLLYALGWRDGAGKACIANAFVEKIWDSFGGWKGRGAWGHCSVSDYSAWISGHGEYQGLSVTTGLSGAAALVKVTWLTGDVTFVQPINGAYMSVLFRHGARASTVEFLDVAGSVLASIQPYG